MSIGLQVTPPFVTISSDDPVTRFAAAEWVRYAVAAGGPPLTAVGLEPGLLATPAHDSLRLVAATPRELLQAVYGGLEERGWRWFLPGPLGEAFLPGTPSPRGTRPGFAARLLVDRSSLHDAALWRTEALHIIEWMSRNQLTTLAIENEDLQPEAIGWLIDELARRGLALEVGGDIVPHLLAQTRADEPPPVRHRRGRHHARRLEVADPAALAALPAATAAELARFQPATALRLAEPAEPPLATDETPELARPGTRLSAVAEAAAAGLDAGALVVWQPQSTARRGFQPPAGVRLVLPVERRSLAHGLGDDADPRHANLRQSLAAAGGRPGGAELTLPYADLLALHNLTGPLTQVIAADLRSLLDGGGERVSVVVCGTLSWWAYGLNLYVYARCAAAPDLDPRVLLTDWCRGLFADQASSMETWLAAYEQAMTELWRLRDAQRDPMVQAWRAGEPRGRGLLDQITAAVATLELLQERLESIRGAAREPLAGARLDRELEAVALNRLFVQLHHLRLQAQFGLPSPALHASARELVTLALGRVDQLPLTACGGALRTEYRETLRRFAVWCGHESTRS